MGRHVPVIVFFLGLSACAFRQPVPMQTYPEVEPTSSILAMDRPAWKLVAVAAYDSSREEDGRLRVKMELANLSRLDVPIQVRTEFRDKDGRLMGDETSWQMMVLPGNGSSAYDVVSLKPDPGGFTVQVRTP